MKLYYGGLVVGEGNPRIDDFQFNCTRNRSCQKAFYVPVNSIGDITFYADLPFGKPDTITINLIDGCTGETYTGLVSSKYIVGKKPDLSWYGIFGHFVAPEGFSGSTCFHFELIFTVGEVSYIFFSEQFCQEVCGDLMFLQGCYPNEPLGTDATDCNGIYYGFAQTDDFLGNYNYRYFHWAYVRLGSIIEQKNKFAFSIFNSKWTYKNDFTREYLLEFEPVPTFYKNVIIGIYNRGNIKVNGTNYLLSAEQELNILDEDSKIWHCDALLTEECLQYFGCGQDDCELPDLCCDPTNVTASVDVCCDPVFLDIIVEDVPVETLQLKSFGLPTGVTDGSDVSQWNAFFDLPANGTPFTSVVVDGSWFKFYGGSGIAFKDHLFDGFSGLRELIDEAGVIVAIGNYSGFNTGLENVELIGVVTVGDSAFTMSTNLATVNLPAVTSLGNNCFDGIPNVDTIDMPLLVSAGDYCFNNMASLATVNLPSLQTAGDLCFAFAAVVVVFDLPSLISAGQNCFAGCISATTFNLPNATTIGDNCFNTCGAATTFDLSSCANLGSTTGDNQVFFTIAGNTITLTILTATSTDDDVVWLQTYNTVTLITV